MSISLLFNTSDHISLSALKTINLKKDMVRTLTVSGENTIPNLSKETGYSIPTITRLIGELLEEGIVYDFGKIDTAGGRRPSIYGINPNAFYFLGVEVKRTAIAIGLQSADNKNVKIAENIEYSLENNRESLDKLCDIINNFIDKSEVPRQKIVGACINLTGRINSREGFSYSFFYFEEKPLSAIIESKINVKTYLENDSRAMTFGEYNCGVVKNEQEVLFVNISWGLGMGIVCKGGLYYGKSGYSGEFGHAPVFNNDVICQCGKKGCLETEVSGWALEREIRIKLRSGATSVLTKIKDIDSITVDQIIHAVVEQEDVLAIEVIEEMGEKLGRYLAMLVNIFNPELVIIGGTLAAVSDYLQLPVQTALKRHSLNLVNQDVKFKTSKLGANAGVVGACYIVRGKFFDLI
ncbi:MAG: ROK family protein [Bacteroidales bacterium]|jgi:predicted NBD/HSP70 family sugar kinase|nr:ROK family protein [Bacteroidales bacterium]